MRINRTSIGILFFASLAAVNCSDVNSDGVPDCRRTFCGCWQDVLLEFTTIFLNHDNLPLADIEVYCAGEQTPRSVSDPSGVAAFKVLTQRSPGCHYAICSNLIFKDKNQTYKAQQFTVYQANGQALFLNRIK
ncbi:MAG: hypothetical protein PVH43_04650 [Desulfobacterales bacterium]|jgi:hypothetical protein